LDSYHVVLLRLGLVDDVSGEKGVMPFVRFRHLTSPAASMAIVAAVWVLSVLGAKAMTVPHPPAPCRCTTYCTCLDNGCCPQRVCTGNCNPVFGGAAPSRTPVTKPPLRPVTPWNGGRSK